MNLLPLAEWQTATLVMAIGAAGPIEPGDDLRDRVRGELAAIDERVRGNRTALPAVNRSNVSLLVAATLRRALEIAEGVTA